ncbi:MAG: YccF domain-containing protein [Methylophilus sp.]|nr:YccF domain-containing protein [Methylophilus sp.]
MRSLGNFLWFIFGGFFMGLAWWFFGILAFITIIGIPWGKACSETCCDFTRPNW